MTELPKGEALLPLLDSLPAKQVAEECFADPVLFLRYFLEHLFPTPLPWVHRGIVAILTRRTDFLHSYGQIDKIIENFIFERDGKTYRIFERRADGNIVMFLGRYTLLMLPRGFAKTTLAGIGLTLYDIYYMLLPVLLYVSDTSSHSEQQLDNISREIETNARLRAVFGAIKPDRSTGKPWSADQIETTTGVTVVAKGAGAQVRGLNVSGERPWKVIGDDLEDMESVSTDIQRAKRRAWAFGDLLPCLPEMKSEATMTVLGTLLHPAALLEVLAADPQWTPIRFGAIDRQGELLWPENLDESKLALKKRSFAKAGALQQYYLEYFNEARSPDTQPFRREYFRYGMPEARDGEIMWAVYCDPAISESARADEATVYAAGIGLNSGRIFVAPPWHKRGAKPREIVDAYFEMSKRYGARQHGVETTAYQAALVHLMREEMFRKKHYFEITSVTHTQKSKKVDRIKGILQPRYANGYVWHQCPLPDLEEQLLDFPAGAHDDHPDGLCGAISLLDPYAAAAAEDIDLSKDEFDPLEENMAEGDVLSGPAYIP